MTYKIKLVSRTNATVFLVVGLIIFLVSAGTLLPAGGLQNDRLAISLVAGIAIVTYILWQILVTGRAVWTIDEEGIKIVWTKHFFLIGSENDIIHWSEIKDITRGVDPMYYNLKIEVNAGYSIQYYHDTLTTRDDFQEMLKALYKMLSYKKKLQPT